MPRKGRGGGKKGGGKKGGGKKGKAGKRRRDDSDEEDAADFADAVSHRRAPPAKAAAFEDEEIDEDGAFNSDDEAKYGDLMPDYMKSTAQGSDDDDDDDIDEDLGDSDEEGGGMLLSDILTQTLRKEAASKGGMSQAEAAAQSLAAQRASSGAQGGGDSDSSASDVDSALEDSSDDDNSGGEDGGHAMMMSMVDKLVAGSTKRVKRKGSARVAEAIEPLAEAEYNLAPDRGGLAGGLSLEALVGSLRNTTQYGGLKRKLDALGSGPAPLQAPAGRVVEERASRQVQYQLTTKDVTKWQPLVAANRRAPHLAFDHEQPHAPKLSVAALHDKFLPATSLEKDVAKLLNRSGLGDNKAVRAAETDELQVNEVSAEEIKKRHGQLQKLKALLFYDELKKRRANKIKSKAYRRVKKRQEKRKAEKQREELRRLDPEAAAKLDEQDAMDIARARITLKHRNKGKWMKWAMKHGGAREESNREGLAAAHARPEELRRKMERMAGDADASDSSESDGDSDESEGARRKRKLGQYVDRARGLLDDGSDDGAGEGGGKPTGIHALKFMQDVTQRRREQARKEAAALVTELEALADDPDGKGKGKGKGKGEGSNSQAPTGRRSFAGSKVGGGNKWGEGLNAGTLEEKLQADKDMAAALGGGSGGGRVGLQVQQLRSSASNKVRMDGAITVDGVDSGVADAGADSDGSSGDSDGSDGSDGTGNDGGKGGDSKAAENPWMARKSKRANKSRKATAARLPVADVLKAIGSSGDGDAQAKASSNAAAGGKGDAEWGSVVDGEWKKGGKQSNNGKGKGKGDKANGKSDEGALHQTEATRAERKRKAAQQELVRRAFAGVGADEEFAAEKEKIADDAAPKPEPAAKAGWGSWTGKGALPPPPPPKRRRKLVPEKPAIKVKKPKFHAVKHLIVNEKRDKKAVKYLADTVPYPFKTREQYERSLRNPLGRDWNTVLTTETLVRPEVTSKMGQLIEPVKYSKPLKRGGRVETSVTVRRPALEAKGKGKGKGKKQGGKKSQGQKRQRRK